MVDFFLASINSLKLSPFTCSKLQSLISGNRIIDVLLHFPSYFIEREKVNKISAIKKTGDYILSVRIIHHELPLTKRSPYKIICGDDSGALLLNFFHYNASYLNKYFPINQCVKLFGKVEVLGSQLCINHPNRIFNDQDEAICRFEPIYPLTAGITNSLFCSIVTGLLRRIPEIPNWLPSKPKFSESIIKIHTTVNTQEYRNRIALDELITTKIANTKLREKSRLIKGKIIDCNVDISDVTNDIPFELTNDQISAINDIKNDLSSKFPMSRLLQGDVGSGKTIVAMIATKYAIENNMQVAVLAPTEILSRQHLHSFKTLFKDTNIELFYSKNKKEKNKRLQELAAGDTQIAIGTHSLIQNDIKFKNLGLVIIDEQHKFGVKQRSLLMEKGNGVNVLYLSATPIPRTLMMTVTGDMDISIIMEKPKNRIPVITSVIPNSRLQEVIQKIAQKKDSKVYWVCPLIEASEKSDLQAATERYEHLKNYFHENVLLLHGKIKQGEKETIMDEFTKEGFKILVATTVIEVGIDVKDADIMIIEHAERFGLAQLHQLRGRVGRGQKQSFCILMYDHKLSNVAKQRLNAIKNSENGFDIAEKDLEIRGFGDLLGLQQTGLQEFKVADPTDIQLIRELEKIKIEKNPELEKFYFDVFEKIISQ